MSKREREQELWEARQDAAREKQDEMDAMANELAEGHSMLDRMGIPRTIPDSDGSGTMVLTLKGRLLRVHQGET